MIKKCVFLLVFSLFAAVAARADVMDLRDNAPKGGEAAGMLRDFNAKRQYQPVFLLLISERVRGETQAKAWWIKESSLSRAEVLLKDKLKIFGCRVIEPGQAYGIIFKNPAYGRPEISDSQAIELARQLGADYLVIGEAAVKGPDSVLEASNNRSYDAVLKARFLSVKNRGVRKKIFSSGRAIDSQIYEGMSRALENAAREAALTIGAVIREKQR